MSRKVLLISLRINPAFVQHLIAYAKAVQTFGDEAVFLLDRAYSRFSELKNTAPVLTLGESDLDAYFESAIIMNPSLKNLETVRRLKARGTRILYIFHEPWQLSLDYVRNEGLKATCLAALAHRFTVPVLRTVDHVLLPSEYALRVYRSTDAQYNGRASYMPLLYDDELGDELAAVIQQKRYFSYIGSPCHAHGFDRFLKVVRYALERNLDIQFLIASRHSLPSLFLHDRFLRNSDRITIQCGRLLSSEEINRCYAQSICVWNVYRRSTQSGVLPKALMFGAPVLCSQVGSFSEFVSSGRNGQVVPADDPECIIEAYQRFQQNVMTYATQCRHDFLSTFYYRAHLRDLAPLLS